jgi:hypothetical protein
VARGIGFLLRSCLVCALGMAALAFAGSSALGQDTVRVLDTPNMQIGDDALSAFRTVEKAWQSGNAQALADLLGGSRAYVEIRGIEGSGGYFTKPQFFYIFKDMFASMKQLNFAFVKYYSRERDGTRVYGIAQRTYKSNRSNKLFKDRVYVTLVKEESRWAVVEITSTW